MVDFPNESEEAATDLARVASYVSVVDGRGNVIDFLKEKIPPNTKPSPLHELLAEAARRFPLLIVTTNYDDLMETALRDVPHDVVVTAVERNDYAGAIFHKPWQASDYAITDPQDLRLPINPDNATVLERTVVFKMHGTISQPNGISSFVVTEEDYVAYLAGMSGTRMIPPQIHTLMRPRQFLFLGYALRDWNLRVLLDSIKRGSKRNSTASDDNEASMRKVSYAISRSMELDEQKIWERREVTVRLADFTNMVPQLRQELEAIWARS